MRGNTNEEHGVKPEDANKPRGVESHKSFELDTVGGARNRLPTSDCPSDGEPNQERCVRSIQSATVTAPPAFRALAFEQFVEAEAAAEFLHYSPRTVKQMARDNRIPAHPFGNGPRKKWYFLISELAEHLRAKVNSGHGEAGRDKTPRRVH